MTTALATASPLVNKINPTKQNRAVVAKIAKYYRRLLLTCDVTVWWKKNKQLAYHILNGAGRNGY